MMEPQFLPGCQGPLFALYHPPQRAPAALGSVLYIHPLADELNRARRMAALQARRFAAAGRGVLLLDLYGCGDSDGDFNQARWDIWLTDLCQAANWLQDRQPGPLTLWGLRLGTLLATELVWQVPATRLILWQPIHSGVQALTQFLRLRLAAGLATGNRESTAGLRQQLAAGHSLEVAGYELHPALAASLEQAALRTPPVSPALPVHWFELVTGADQTLSLASQQRLAEWRAAGVTVQAQVVSGEPFWFSLEIGLAPALLEATSGVFRTGDDGDD
jgi:exosortase A-associated hydrolase 2